MLVPHIQPAQKAANVGVTIIVRSVKGRLGSSHMAKGQHNADN